MVNLCGACPSVIHFPPPRPTCRSLIRCLPAEGAACGQFWSRGFGQLTAVGESQLRTLGGLLRQRYTVLLQGGLPPTYAREQVYIRSTNYDRTLQSAMSLLQGMFAPGTGLAFPNGSFALQGGVAVPPVHTVQLASDLLLRAFNGDTCSVWPNMVQAEQAAFATEFQQHIAASDGMTAALGAAVGLPNLTYAELGGVADSLLCMRAHGRTWPAGVTQAMYTAAHAEAQWALFNTYRQLPQRQASGGTALGMLAARLTAAATPGGVQPQFDPSSFPAPSGLQARGPTLAVYSAHDTTLLTLLYALLGPAQVLANPPYASTVIVELVGMDGGGDIGTATPAVRLWYNRGIGTGDSGGHSAPFDTANLLQLPGCANVGTGGDVLCSLPDWLAGTAAIAQADVSALCAVGGEQDKLGRGGLSPGAATAAGAGGMLALLLLALGARWLCRRREVEGGARGPYGTLHTPPPHHD